MYNSVTAIIYFLNNEVNNKMEIKMENILDEIMEEINEEKMNTLLVADIESRLDKNLKVTMFIREHEKIYGRNLEMDKELDSLLDERQILTQTLNELS